MGSTSDGADVLHLLPLPVFPAVRCFQPLGECGGFAGDCNGKYDCAPPVHVARLPDDSSLAVSNAADVAFFGAP